MGCYRSITLFLITYNVWWLYFSCKLRNRVFSAKINVLRKKMLILADILQLNKTTVIASCGCFRKLI